MSLQDRLCAAASKAKALEIELMAARAKLAEFEKPKEAPKLEAVPKGESA